MATPGDPPTKFTQWVFEKVYHGIFSAALGMDRGRTPDSWLRREANLLNDVPLDVQELIAQDALRLIREYPSPSEAG